MTDGGCEFNNQTLRFAVRKGNRLTFGKTMIGSFPFKTTCLFGITMLQKLRLRNGILLVLIHCLQNIRHIFHLLYINYQKEAELTNSHILIENTAQRASKETWGSHRKYIIDSLVTIHCLKLRIVIVPNFERRFGMCFISVKQEMALN